jgi:hypothetical protein
MRKRIIKNHILYGIFIIPVFLILALSSVSAGVSLFIKTGIDMNIRSDVSQDRAFSISDVSYYRASPAAIFVARRSENRLSLISASKGSYLNGVFKKLKRMLSGISKFF